MAIGNHSKNVYKALIMTVDNILSYHPIQSDTVELVTDGGSENHAGIITELIEQTNEPTFKKVIARKDVSFSNSPVEAINKIVKRYLRHFKPDNLQELEKIIPWIVNLFYETNTIL